MITEQISDKESTAENGVSPACVGLPSSVLPKASAIDSAESSDTGVSTNYIQTASPQPQPKVRQRHQARQQDFTGMHCEPLTEESRRHTIIWWQKASQPFTQPYVESRK